MNLLGYFMKGFSGCSSFFMFAGLKQTVQLVIKKLDVDIIRAGGKKFFYLRRENGKSYPIALTFQKINQRCSTINGKLDFIELPFRKIHGRGIIENELTAK